MHFGFFFAVFECDRVYILIHRHHKLLAIIPTIKHHLAFRVHTGFTGVGGFAIVLGELILDLLHCLIERMRGIVSPSAGKVEPSGVTDSTTALAILRHHRHHTAKGASPIITQLVPILCVCGESLIRERGSSH